MLGQNLKLRNGHLTSLLSSETPILFDAVESYENVRTLRDKENGSVHQQKTDFVSVLVPRGPRVTHRRERTPFIYSRAPLLHVFLRRLMVQIAPTGALVAGQ
jgi:hypothetical protein